MAFAIALAAFLAAYNNVLNLTPIAAVWHVPINVAAAAGLVTAGAAAGLDARAMGLGAGQAPPALRWGGAIVAGLAVALALGVALGDALPIAGRFLADRRVSGLSGGALAFAVLVRIPLATALLEEVAFRGVLYGAIERHRSALAAVIVSSAVFGLWHIVPTLENLRLNQPGAGAGTRALLVAGAVVATGIGGALLALLRIATGGVLAPWIAHAAMNSLGALAAWLAQRG